MNQLRGSLTLETNGLLAAEAPCAEEALRELSDSELRLVSGAGDAAGVVAARTIRVDRVYRK